MFHSSLSALKKELEKKQEELRRLIETYDELKGLNSE